MEHPFKVLRPEYERLLAAMVITRPQAVEAAARSIIKNVPKYYAPVEKANRVPAIETGVLNMRESDEDFRTGLGQGDPWNKVSVHVPRGYGPFASWYDAAIFYEHYDHLDDNTAPWDYAYACWKSEIWNGFGYRSHGVNSPYLWAGSNHQEPGKYVADGVWDSGARDTQLGVIPVMMKAIQLEPSLAFGPSIDHIESPPLVPLPLPDGVGGGLIGARWIQHSLNVLGAVPQLVVDGNYGRRTREAVRSFQKAHGLDQDGLAGDLTCAAIDVELAKPKETS